MAATSPKNSSFIPDLEAATQRARETNDRLAEVSRKVTTAYLDGVENYVKASISAARELIAA